MSNSKPHASILFVAVILACAQSARADEAADPYAPGRAIVGDIGRITAPNGVQDSFAAELGGTKQWVTVRGSDRDNPLLLYIHGGPAAPETPVAWAFQRPWEDFFTVVQWDQRAAGKSYRLNSPAKVAPTLSVDRYVDDAIELILLLRKKYEKQKIILVGHSWGTIIGLSVAMKRPHLLHAYVGVGSVINFRENERAGFEWTLAQAIEDGNEVAVKELEAIEPYPGSGDFDPEKTGVERKWSIHYGALSAYRDNAEYYFHAPRLSPEYTPRDIEAWGAGSALTIKTLFPKLATVSFDDVHRLETPIFLFVGRHDYTTPSSLAVEWLAQLRAPKKGVVWFENSAHLVPIEQPGRMLWALLTRVRPIAEQAGDGEKL